MSVATHKFGEKIFVGNADGLRTRIDPLFDDSEVRDVVFDLENVRMCDSYGLKFLITYHRKARATGKNLYLFRPDVVLREMLDSTKLSQVFTVTDSLPIHVRPPPC